eukprot:1303634-Rhodomonas_salina.1
MTWHLSSTMSMRARSSAPCQASPQDSARRQEGKHVWADRTGYRSITSSLFSSCPASHLRASSAGYPGSDTHLQQVDTAMQTPVKPRKERSGKLP